MRWSIIPRQASRRLRLAARHARCGRVGWAFERYVRATRRGGAEAADQDGRTYFEGESVAFSRADAAHWLGRATRQGHTEAQTPPANLPLLDLVQDPQGTALPRGLGGLFASNTNSGPDFPAARRAPRRGGGRQRRPGPAEPYPELRPRNDTRPKCHAKLVSAGRGGRVAPWRSRLSGSAPRQRSATWAGATTSRGMFLSARYWYGLVMADGRSVPVNLAKARRHFSCGADLGVAETAAALAELLINGRGGPADPARARRYLVRASGCREQRRCEVRAWRDPDRALGCAHRFPAAAGLGPRVGTTGACPGPTGTRPVCSVGGVGRDRYIEAARIWHSSVADLGVAEARADLESLEKGHDACATFEEQAAAEQV